MKKSIGLLLVLALSLGVAKAQEFKKFRVGVGTGYAAPGGKGAKAGVLLYFDPAYRIQDQILVGLRFEFAGMVRGYEQDVNTGSASVSFAGSQALFGQYYFNNNSFRPFVGLGLGLYHVSTAAVAYSNGSATADAYAGVNESKFGFFPRVGFDAGHFSLSIDVNLVGKSTVPSLTGSGNDLTTKNGYVGVRIGGFFGGGRK